MEHRGGAGRIDTDALRRRLPITDAECAVLARLMEGDSLRAIATRRHLALETVRSYVKSLLRKTQCHRQVQLVAYAWRIIATLPDADSAAPMATGARPPHGDPGDEHL